MPAESSDTGLAPAAFFTFPSVNVAYCIGFTASFWGSASLLGVSRFYANGRFWATRSRTRRCRGVRGLSDHRNEGPCRF